MYIYKITNICNKKIYVGQTIQTLNTRLYRHIYDSTRGTKTKFCNAIRKYGADNFKIEALEVVGNREDLDEREVFWIKELNSVKEGYNSNYGGLSQGGDTLTGHIRLDEIRKVLSEGKMGSKNPHSTKVKCINTINGSFKIYGSFSECQKELNIPRHDIIGRRCKGKITKPYDGKYMFEYVVEGQETIEMVSKEKHLRE